MSVYSLPVLARSSFLDPRPTAHEARTIRGIGYMVHFSGKSPPDDLVLRGAIQHEAYRVRFVASTVKKAIREFYRIPGTQTGGKILDTKALRIDPTAVIYELPRCKHLPTKNSGDFTCALNPLGRLLDEEQKCAFTEKGMKHPDHCPFRAIPNREDRKAIVIPHQRIGYSFLPLL